VEGFEDWLRDFDLHLRGSVATLSRTTYLRGPRQFVEHLAEHHPDVAGPGDVTRRHVESWLAAMTEAGRSPGTRRIRLKSIGLWFKWLSGELESKVTAIPTAGVAMPKPQLKPVPIVRDEEIAALLSTCNSAAYADRRDAAMIRLLFDCGIRRAELVGLETRDVDLKYLEAVIRAGKGGKVRIVPFGNRTALALSRYERARRTHPGAVASPALFLATRPSQANGDPWRLGGGGVAEMLGRRSGLAGIRPINPHAFRHTFSHDMLANGAGESDVERLAGWSSPMMIRRYGSSAADERARDTHRRLARGDRL
jgi:integrase